MALRIIFKAARQLLKITMLIQREKEEGVKAGQITAIASLD